MRLKIVLFVLAVGIAAFGQGACRRDNVFSKDSATGALTAVSGASVRVCPETDATTPCAVSALFSDSALTVPLSNPLTTDSRGAYGYCAAPATYNEQISGSGLNGMNNRPVTLGLGGALPAMFATQSNGSPAAGTFTTVKAQKLISGLDVRYFGAKCDSATDDTAAIQAALTAASATGAEVVLPPLSGCKISGSTSCLLTTTAASLRGGGYDSVLLVAASVAGTKDVLCVSPTAELKGLRLHDFSIIPVSGTPGHYGIQIDASTYPVKEALVEGVFVETLGAQSFHAQGHFFSSTIRNSFFNHCMSLDTVEDSVHVENNQIAGEDCTGIYATFAVGASKSVFRGNNIVSKKGGISVPYSNRLSVTDNYVETLSGYDPTFPCISLGSDHANLTSEPALDKNFASCALVANTDAVSLDNVYKPVLSFNTLYAAGTGVAVRTTSLTASPLLIPGSCSAVALGLTCDFTGAATNPAIAVLSTKQVAGHALSADVTVSKSDVGLGNVDNTSDANKSVAIANASDYTGSGTWTPSATNLGNTGGAPTISGVYTKIGRVVYFTITIVPVTNTTAGATTYFSTPSAPAEVAASVLAADSNGTSYASGNVSAVAGGKIFPPYWTALGATVYVSGWYRE